MKVSQLGEFGLIESLQRVVDRRGVGARSRSDVILGIGDDAAAWQAEGFVQLGTTDTLVQDIHFTPGTISWHNLGWKALAVNVSDIAAMGGTPTVAMVSLSLPLETEVEHMEEMYEGMAECARRFQTAVVGGNIARSPVIVVTVSLVGQVEKERMLTRSSARAGDAIAVTGTLGASAAGLGMLKQRLALAPEISSALKEAHLRPVPRVEEGQTLAQHGVKSAIDISDGLLADLTHICEASRVGARIHLQDIPVHPAARRAFGDDALGLALSGGEDYELLFTAPGAVIERAKRGMLTPVRIIGGVVSENPGKVTLVNQSGEEVEWAKGGWEHFGGSED